MEFQSEIDQSRLASIDVHSAKPNVVCRDTLEYTSLTMDDYPSDWHEIFIDLGHSILKV